MVRLFIISLYNVQTVKHYLYHTLCPQSKTIEKMVSLSGIELGTSHMHSECSTN